MQTIPLTEAHYFLLIAAFAAICGALVGRIIAEETYDRRSAIFFGGYTGAGIGLTAGPPFAVLLSLTLMGFVFFKMAEFADSRIVFWRHDDRLTKISRKRAAKWKG